MIYDEIKLDYNIEASAREDIKRLIVDGSAEMNEFQHAFVAGLFKKYKPRKILEIGIAAGGTTCFLHECKKKYGYKLEIFSVDKFENYYRVPSKKTGHLLKEMVMCDGYEDILEYQHLRLVHTSHFSFPVSQYQIPMHVRYAIAQLEY